MNVGSETNPSGTTIPCIDISATPGVTVGSGGVINNGMISPGSPNGINIHNGSSIVGAIVNTGQIDGALEGIQVTGAIVTGGITNSGTISALGDHGISFIFAPTFAGGITNSGTITSATHSAVGFDIISGGVSGDIINTPTGKIMGGSTGIFIGGSIGPVSFTGNISNAGTISGVNQFGIGLLQNPNFNGSIINASTGTISGGNVGIIDGLINGVSSTITGGITNAGTISGGNVGIQLNLQSRILGGITNTGDITGNIAAIDLRNEGAATTINNQGDGTITGATNAILLSGLGDTVNISGGTINGNIVGQAASGTVNFNLGAGNTLTYASNFLNVNQVNVDSGTVLLNGDNNSANAVAVRTGGTLGGEGTVTGAVTAVAVTINDGTFSPGTPGMPGSQMTIGTPGSGSTLIFASGSTYRVFLNPTIASFATVNGTANLTLGTVDPIFLPGAYSIGKEFLILHTTDGLNTTTFSGQVPTNIKYMLTYENNDTDVFLTITALSLGTGTQLNVNQQNVANAINAFASSGAILPPGFDSLFSLTGADLANALTQLSGEVSTGAERSAFNVMTQFMNLMTDPYAVGFAPQPQQQPGYVKAPPRTAYLKAPPALPPLEQHWTAWGAGFGGTNHANGDAVIGSHDITASDWGFAAGMDYHYSPNTLLGFALAGAGTNWGLADGLGSGRSDAFMAGVHGATHFGPAYLTGAFGFANHWFTIDRTSFDSDQLRSTFNGQSYAVRFEGGYRFAVPFAGAGVGITPYAAVQSQWFHTPTYSESDLTGGGFGLTYDAMTANDTRSELGARFDDLTTFYGNPLILRARLAWAHDWVDTPALNAVFQGLPGSTFTVFGAPIPHNSALTTASAELHFAPNWSFTAKFDGEFASDSQTYAGTGTLRYTW